MKNVFDIVADVRALLMVDELLSRIDGTVYPFVKPGNSSKQDITVSVLSANNKQVQQATVNIRIHSPNIKSTINGEIHSLPGLKNFNELSAIVCQLTDGVYKSSFYTIVSSPGELYQDANGSFVSVIQLDYYSIQNDYKHI